MSKAGMLCVYSFCVQEKENEKKKKRKRQRNKMEKTLIDKLYF